MTAPAATLTDALQTARGEQPLLDLPYQPGTRQYALKDAYQVLGCEPAWPEDDEVRPINVLASLAFIAGMVLVIGVALLCCWVILSNFLIVAGAR